MRESDIEKYLVGTVEMLGGECRKLRWIGRRGAPDRVIMMDGDTIWIELKATGEKAKPHQLREHARIRKMGQRVEVIDSVEAVDELFGM